MKKIMMLLAFMAFALPVFCQEVLPPVPEDWMDVLVNLKSYLATFSGAVVLTAFLAAVLNGIFKVTGKFLRQLVAWLVAIALLVVADLVNFGFVADFPVLFAAANGLAVGLAANGTFDIPWLKSLLDKLEGFFNKPKE